MQNVHSLLPTLKKAYPHITFVKGDLFVWSPKTKTVTYSEKNSNNNHAIWALIHEVAHADLHHTTYINDIHLIKHEVEAWQHAKTISTTLGLVIEEDHIQDCLDTYRDWIHKRATCPTCNVIGTQHADLLYSCFNCRTKWKVPASPLCRTNRRTVSE